jgi:nucleolar protein 9
LDLPETEQRNLVPALMTLKTWPTYQAIKSGKPVEDEGLELPEEIVDADAEQAAAAAARYEGWKNRRTAKPKETDLAPNMQGCLLLQGMVRLPGGNEIVLERWV